MRVSELPVIWRAIALGIVGVCSYAFAASMFTIAMELVRAPAGSVDEWLDVVDALEVVALVFGFTLATGIPCVVLFGAPVFALLHHFGRAGWMLVLALGAAPFAAVSLFDWGPLNAHMLVAGLATSALVRWRLGSGKRVPRRNPG